MWREEEEVVGIGDKKKTHESNHNTLYIVKKKCDRTKYNLKNLKVYCATNLTVH